MNVAVAEFAPIQILALGDDREDRIVLLPGAVFKLRHPDVKNGEDEIASAKLGFAREERLKFKLAIRTPDHGRRDDRNKEHRLRNRRLDLRGPKRTGRDRLLVLPKPECLHR